MKWNVGNKATREQEVENIIENINRLAIPYFEKFNNIPNLVAEIEERGDYWGFIKMSYIAEFLLYVSTKETIERTLSNFLTKRKSWKKYHNSLIDLEKGIQLDGTYWSQIAKLTKDLNLKLNEE